MDEKKTNSKLPEFCYSILPSTGEIIIIKNGETGYFKTEIIATSKEEARFFVDEYNGILGITKAQEEAMKTGSMFGWNVPGADPDNYYEDGRLR